MWHKRWFSLVGRELHYGKDPNTAEKGKISLQNTSEITIVNESKKQRFFIISMPNGKIYRLYPEEEAEFDRWILILNRVREEKESDFQIRHSDLDIEEKIIESQTSDIHYVFLKNTAKQYVMKSYQRSKFPSHSHLQRSIDLRVSALSIACPYVSPLRFIIPNDESISFVYEFSAGGRLFDRLETENKILEDEVKFYIAEMIIGLIFYHTNNMFYGDLKPSNILLDGEGHINLSGPGLYPPGGLQDFQFPEYTAPELHYGGTPNAMSDIYSLGVLMCELICGMPPFYDQNKSNLIHMSLYSPLLFPNHVSNEARTLISALMSKNPCSRPSLESSMSHSFFHGVDWDAIKHRKIAPPIHPKDLAAYGLEF